MFQIARLKDTYGICEGDHFQSLTIQDSGGTRSTIDAGVARLRDRPSPTPRTT